MPNKFLLAQADTRAQSPVETPAPAGIEAQVEAQIQDLVTEIQVPPRPTSDGGNSAAAVVGTLVPIVFFIAVAAVFGMRYYLAYRARQDVQTTVRQALERGVPLSGELLDRIVETPAPKRSDLRRGAIWVALGIGLAAFGLAVGEEDAVRPMLAVGTVPFLLGVAYLALWRFGDGKPGREPGAERGG